MTFFSEHTIFSYKPPSYIHSVISMKTDKHVAKLKEALEEAEARIEEAKKTGFISLAFEGADLLITATKRYIEAAEAR